MTDHPITLAQRLFDTYRAALPNANIRLAWPDLPEDMQHAWQQVATQAQTLLNPPNATPLH